VPQRSATNYFPSKDELIEAYLSRRFRPISPSDAPPAEQVFAEFDRLERNFAGDGVRGCPFVNAVAELGDPTHAARRIAVAFKEQRRIWFRAMLTRLGAGDPDGLATQLSLLVDGAIAAALVRGDPTMARAARETARTLLIAAGAQLRSSETSAKRSASRRAGRPRAARS
jgi:AcrR family transcriptional regulator